MTEYFKHPAALVESTRIRQGTRMGAFAHVLPRAAVGCDCLPFPPQRFYITFDVPTREVRGQRAYRTLEQLLVCIETRKRKGNGCRAANYPVL